MVIIPKLIDNIKNTDNIQKISPILKRYIQKYGIKGIEVTEKEVKKAMDNSDVWSGESNSYYRE